MKIGYHEGEIEMQRRAGTREEAARMNRGIAGTLTGTAQAYLGTLRLIIVGSVDSERRAWASALAGEPGFLSIESPQSLAIHAVPHPGDALVKSMAIGAPVGLLAIDLAARRRLRINGRAWRRPDDVITVEVEEVFGNCPKYIQSREMDQRAAESTSAVCAQAVVTRDALTPEQREWIERADTFFIASAHPSGRADVSHRGGMPGFVRVSAANKLVWPDYSGNGMFQTLGNLLTNPRAGLLFADFEQGRTLQLTGTARVIEDAARTAEFAGAERLVEFEVEQAIEIAGAFPRGWRFLDYSPYNPT